MFARFLAPHESLEEIRAEVSRLAGRPAYVLSGSRQDCADGLYSEPGSDVYRPMGAVELFFSLWSHGYPVGVFDEEGRKVEDPHKNRPAPGHKHVFRYDLTLAQRVHVAYPLKPDQKANWLHHCPHFAAVRLGSDLNYHGKVLFIDDGDVHSIPEELRPYVATYPDQNYRGRLRTGIRFAMSAAVEQPVQLRDSWHIAVSFQGRGPAVSLQPPGWYSGLPVLSLGDENRFCLADADPGPCIVCRGRSGRRRHVAVVVSGDSQDTTSGHICSDCFPSFALQVSELLRQWDPPRKDF